MYFSIGTCVRYWLCSSEQSLGLFYSSFTPIKLKTKQRNSQSQRNPQQTPVLQKVSSEVSVGVSCIYRLKLKYTGVVSHFVLAVFSVVLQALIDELLFTFVYVCCPMIYEEIGSWSQYRWVHCFTMTFSTSQQILCIASSPWWNFLLKNFEQQFTATL